MADVSVLDVFLYGEAIGSLTRIEGDRTIFAFSKAYTENTDRPTLGLHFKDEYGHLRSDFGTALPVMPFFSNLLPEGFLRDYLSKQIGAEYEDEFNLLWALGGDLPGAITMFSADGSAPPTSHRGVSHQQEAKDILRFSLAGVQMKLSSAAQDSRWTIPASGAGGSWIIKLPSWQFEALPENEFSMMELARSVGIAVPPIKLIDIADIGNFPKAIEKFGDRAFAIRRFDRAADGSLIHIEDFAQVFGVAPDRKYERATMRDIAHVLAMESGDDDMREFIRRIVFNILIGNGDMHLKNWSLIYNDKRTASLSPAYDFVSTIPYIRGDKMALKLSRTKDFNQVTEDELRHFANKVSVSEKLVLETAAETVQLFHEVWQAENRHLPMHRDARKAIEKHVERVVLGN